MGNSGTPKSGLPPDTIEIKCEGKTHPADDPNGKSWSPCDYKQFCAKLKAVERQAKQKGKQKRFRSKAKYEAARKKGDKYAEQFRNEWPERRKKLKKPESKFYHKCAYKEAANGKNVDDFEPDHVHEVQHGGPPSTARNIKWCKWYVNKSLGGHLQSFKPPKHKKIKADCCPR